MTIQNSMRGIGTHSLESFHFDHARVNPSGPEHGSCQISLMEIPH